MDKISNDAKTPQHSDNTQDFLAKLWITTKEILFHPSRFFTSVVDGADVPGAFAYYISITVVTFILEVILLVITDFETARSILTIFLSPFSLVFIILVPVMVIAGIYVAAGIMHLFVLLFKGEGGYDGTFKVLAYSYAAEPWCYVLISIAAGMAKLCLAMLPSAPPHLKTIILIAPLLIFPIVLLLGFIWTAVITIIGYTRIHNLSAAKASSACLIPILIAVFLTFSLNFRNNRDTADSTAIHQAAMESMDKSELTMAKYECVWIYRGCRHYFTIKGSYPFSLIELVNLRQDSIDPSLAHSTSTEKATLGYYFVYKSQDKDHFTLYAKPIGPSHPVFFINETGLLRLNGPDGPETSYIPDKK